MPKYPSDRTVLTKQSILRKDKKKEEERKLGQTTVFSNPSPYMVMLTLIQMTICMTLQKLLHIPMIVTIDIGVNKTLRAKNTVIGHWTTGSGYNRS